MTLYIILVIASIVGLPLVISSCVAEHGRETGCVADQD